VEAPATRHRLLPVIALFLGGLVLGCSSPDPAHRVPATPTATETAADPQTWIERHRLRSVGQFEADLTQDGLPEQIHIAAPIDCGGCDVRHVVVFQRGLAVLDVEALSPQVAPLPGRFGITIREALELGGGAPPCCDGDHLTHTFVWDGAAFVADRRAEALRDALSNAVDAFIGGLDPQLQRRLDRADARHPAPQDRAALDQYQQLLIAACRADDGTLLRAYRRWWHDRLFDGLVGPATEVLPRYLADPRAMDDFVSWSLMR
jgi:hypothetical protein